ncbi:MAG: type II toxin-antitoxin system RelE/ParE family toxin [Gemmatimonadaceae bacterium]
MSEIAYFEFILTPTYARDAKGVITDDEQRAIEEAIYKNPDAGAPIEGGARKLRVPLPGRGKRGGARVIYFVILEKGRVYLLNVYPKNVRENLTAGEKKGLAKRRKLLREE